VARRLANSEIGRRIAEIGQLSVGFGESTRAIPIRLPSEAPDADDLLHPLLG
jgi:hypothetical protein